jgi:ATP-dependent RNA helicase DeaD
MHSHEKSKHSYPTTRSHSPSHPIPYSLPQTETISSNPPVLPTKEISFSQPVTQAVKELGYSTWTPIQEATIPLILAGKDIIGQAHTGSGKTAAFGLPIIEKLNPNGKVQALILVPTRELCEQVMQEMRKFAKHKRTSITAVYGGASMGMQIQHLRRTDVVVGTPGRILDHLSRGTFNPDHVKTLVLDEADRMFDMGFIRDMKKIIQRLSTNRQTMLFSATMPDEIKRIAHQHMKHPETIKTQSYVDAGKLSHAYYDLDKQGDQKFGLLVHILKHEKPTLTIVFCGTRRMVDKVERNLNENGVRAHAIHGGLSQNQRKRTLDEFHHGAFHVLVASDVAARGLDIKNVSHIINYDSPRTSNEYIHRSGRTARAGEEGKIISILAPQDYEFFRQVIRDKSLVIPQLPIPKFNPISITNKKGKPERAVGDYVNPPHYRKIGHEEGENQGYGRNQGQSHGREQGRRFFPRKNEHERGSRPFGSSRPFQSSKPFQKRKPFGRNAQRREEFTLNPDRAPRRPKTPFTYERDFPITKHFSRHRIPKDD